MPSQASYPRKYYSVLYSALDTIPLKEGNIIATYDTDGFYYDVGNPAGSGTNVIRRKANGIEFVGNALPLGRQESTTIFVVETGTLIDEAGESVKTYSGYRWNDDLTPPGFEEVFNNLRDFQVKSVSSSTTQAYILGSVSSSDNVGTLIKNPNVYLTASGNKIHADIEGNADTATDAINAVNCEYAIKARKDNRDQDITSYIKSVEDTAVNNATKLTFTLGDGVTKKSVQTINTQYEIFGSGQSGLVDKTSGVSPSATDTTGLLLTGSGWIPKGNLIIGTSDKAIHDQRNQTIDTTYIKDASYDESSEKLTVFFGDSTTGIPHTKEISIPDTTYSVFTSNSAGLVPAAPSQGGSDMFLKGNGQWSGVFTIGSVGLVPAPTSNDAGKYLRGDHTWQDIPTFTGTLAGLVPSAQASDANKYLRGDGSWSEGNFNTAGSNQDTSKLYVVGAKSQTTGNDGAQTYSNAKVYVQNDKLYSNNSEVIDATSVQSLANKTSYNGYVLDSACAAPIADTLNQNTSVTENFVGDGQTVSFGPFTSTALDIFSVEIDPSANIPYTLDDVENKIVFDTAPDSGANIEVTYIISNDSYNGNALPTSDLVVGHVSDEINQATSRIYDSLSTKLDSKSVASEYGTYNTYAVGDYCTHTDVDGIKLYQCKTAITSYEDFDPLKWEEITLLAITGKVLSGTLNSGSTSLTLTNPSIVPGICFDICTSKWGVNPSNVTIGTGTMTLTFSSQTSSVNVKVRIL